MELARQNLLHDKARFALSLAGIALAIALIVFFNGFLDGIEEQAAAYFGDAPGSVVVAPEGTTTFVGAGGYLPATVIERLPAVDGVGAVVPILRQAAVLDLHGRKEAVSLIGYDPDLGGGPARLAGGREPEAAPEIILDQVLAQRHDIGLGDTVDFLGQQVTVVGLSQGTSTWAGTAVFLHQAALEAVLLSPGAVSFAFLSPAEGVAPEELRDDLRAALPDASPLLKRDLIANDVRLLSDLYSSPIRLMVGIAFVVGTLVVGLIIYTATVEREREYAVLKAIGVRNRLLYRIVAGQAFLTAASGASVGVLAGLGLVQAITALRPQFVLVVTPLAVVLALLAGLVMALLAAVVPTRLIAGVPPADAFRR